MKKEIAVIIGAVLAVGLFTGCSRNESRMQNKPQDVQTTQAPLTQDAADASKFIGEDRAKEIALERAGLTADGVVFDRVELDRDDGIWIYEVEFKKDFIEYDADINAIDGTIRSWEVDRD